MKATTKSNYISPECRQLHVRELASFVCASYGDSQEAGQEGYSDDDLIVYF